MTQLPQLLFGRSAYGPVHRVLERLPVELVGDRAAGLPHSIWEELWHTERWQEFLLARARGEEPSPPAEEWPAGPAPQNAGEWKALLERFFLGLDEAAGMAADSEVVDRSVGGERTVRGSIESLAAHNAYHLGRIVALRQILRAWPPEAEE